MENFSLEENNKLGHIISKLNRKNVIYILGFILFVISFYLIFLNAPRDFRPGTIVRIEPGMSLRTVSSILEKENIIRSRVIFESLMIILNDTKNEMWKEFEKSEVDTGIIKRQVDVDILGQVRTEQGWMVRLIKRKD